MFTNESWRIAEDCAVTSGETKRWRFQVQVGFRRAATTPLVSMASGRNGCGHGGVRPFGMADLGLSGSLPSPDASLDERGRRSATDPTLNGAARHRHRLTFQLQTRHRPAHPRKWIARSALVCRCRDQWRTRRPNLNLDFPRATSGRSDQSQSGAVCGPLWIDVQRT